MKGRSILSVFFVTSIVAGLIYIGQASAQKGNVRTAKSDAVPEFLATQAFLVDDFTASPGTLLTATGWNAHSAGGTNAIATVSGGLSYTGYPSSGIGNSISMTTSGEDDDKSFPLQNSGSVYAAAMINVTAAQTTGDYCLHLNDGPITGNLFKGRLFIKKDATLSTYGFGIQKSSTVNAVYTPTTFTTGTTHLVVIKYTFVAGATNDTVDLIVDPVLGGAEPAPTVTAVLGTDTDAVDIRGVSLRQGTAANAATVQIDGIRVATSWSSITAPAPNRPVDFDGDGRTDYCVVRNVGGPSGQLRWFGNGNGTGAATKAFDWGLNGDVLVPADYDGDGQTDIAVWRPGAATVAKFYILQSATNTVRVEAFGQTGDDPTVVADYNGDGKADLAVYRAGASAGAQSTWFYRTTPNGPVTYVPWGSNGDRVAPGDYDGDGKGDFVVVRNDGSGHNAYWMMQSTAGFDFRVFGNAVGNMQALVPGDYDGDGKTDLAIGDGSGATGAFYYQPSSTGSGFIYFTGGNPSIDELAPGDYDGDGRTDIGLWRNDGTFWILNVRTGGWSAFQLGSAGDVPCGVSLLH